MRSLIKNRKGDLFQLPYLVVLLLVIALVGLLVGFMSWKVTEFYKGVQGVNESAMAKTANERIGDLSPNIVDWMVLFFFIFGTTGLLVAAVRTNFSIVVMGLFIFLLLLSVFIAAQSANIYHGFSEDSTLKPFSSRLTFTNILFSKYTPLIVVLIGAVILIIMYGKSGSNIQI